jgi:16S rRNA (cytidine1402-2'-O)-methyltransferase
VQTLASVDKILVEDTRTTRVLLDHIGVNKPLIALHDHNESQQIEQVLAWLQVGESLALVSDAGTPLISDPGYKLVRALRESGHELIPIPGACAAIAALSVAGLPSDRFLFAGFLPAKSAARRERLQALGRETCTWLVYESSHRIEDCLADLAALLPERRVCLCREISKKFEQSAWLPAQDLPAWLAADANRQRGEFVLVVEGDQPRPSESIDSKRLLSVLLKELPAAKAAKLVAELSGIDRKILYERATQLAAGRAGNR